MTCKRFLFCLLIVLTCVMPPRSVLAQEILYPPDPSVWTCAAFSYSAPAADSIEPSVIVKGGDGVLFVRALTLLGDMGFSPESTDGLITWTDPVLGAFSLDPVRNLISGPELLYKYPATFTNWGDYYVPLRALSEACYWTYSQLDENTALVERLVPSRLNLNKTMQLMMIYGKDARGAEKLMRTMPVTSGAYSSDTPNGSFVIKPLPLNSRNRYYFPTIKTWIKYCSQLRGDYCIHTTYTYSATNLDTKEMRSGYGGLGTRGSNGCIRLLFSDCRFVYYMCAGLTVTIETGEESDELWADKTYVMNQLPEYEDWIAQMLKFEP